MSYLKIKKNFKLFLKNFKKSEFADIIEYLKDLILDYESNPKIFRGKLLFLTNNI